MIASTLDTLCGVWNVPRHSAGRTLHLLDEAMYNINRHWRPEASNCRARQANYRDAHLLIVVLRTFGFNSGTAYYIADAVGYQRLTMNPGCPMELYKAEQHGRSATNRTARSRVPHEASKRYLGFASFNHLRSRADSLRTQRYSNGTTHTLHTAQWSWMIGQGR